MDPSHDALRAGPSLRSGQALRDQLQQTLSGTYTIEREFGGDLLVSFASIIAGEVPPSPRGEAVWRHFHPDSTRFAKRPLADGT